VEVSGGVGRDVAAGRGDLLHLGSAAGIRLPGCHRRRVVGVAPGEQNDRIAGDVHAPQGVPLLQRLGVVLEVQAGDGPGDVGLEVEHPLSVDLVVQDRVAGGPLLHELGEDARLVGPVPLLGKLGEDQVAHGAAPPVGNDRLPVNIEASARHAVGRLGTRVQDPQVLETVAGQLRVGRRRLGPRPPLADDQLVGSQVDRLALAEVLEGQGPHDGGRVFPGVLPVEGGDQFGPLAGDGGLRLQAFLAQARGSLVHGVYPPMEVVRPAASKRPAMACSCFWDGGKRAGIQSDEASP